MTFLKVSTEYEVGTESLSSIADLEELMPSIPWKKYINGLTQPIVSIGHTDRVIRIQSPHYFSNLAKILDKTSPRTIANYMIWRTVAESAVSLGGGIRKVYKDYKNRTSTEKFPERWEECVKLLSDKQTGLAVGISSLYVRNYFDNDSKKAIEPVLHAIIEQFQDSVRKVVVT